MTNPPTEFWFWAWTVLLTVQKAALKDDSYTGEVWENLHIIRARNVEEAYEKALALGRDASGDCRGTLRFDGEPATTLFLGISDIGLIHEELEDGAEILFRKSRITASAARKRVTSQEVLLKRLRKEIAPKLRS